MAIGFPAGITAAYVAQSAQARLAEHRNSLEGCEDFYQWLAAYSVTDLEAAPLTFDAASAQSLLNAFADTHAEYLLHTTGVLPNGYQAGYVYAASQRVVIGPVR